MIRAAVNGVGPYESIVRRLLRSWELDRRSSRDGTRIYADER
jgi:hypothetical protein